MPALPRTVKALGLVSLLTDMSSEMIYPAARVPDGEPGPAFLGLVEGSPAPQRSACASWCRPVTACSQRRP